MCVGASCCRAGIGETTPEWQCPTCGCIWEWDEHGGDAGYFPKLAPEGSDRPLDPSWDGKYMTPAEWEAHEAVRDAAA